MADRALLHKSKLEAFRAWCELRGIGVREGRGNYQVLQVQVGADWMAVFSRGYMPEHYTTEERLIATVRRFIRETRRKKTHEGRSLNGKAPGAPLITEVAGSNPVAPQPETA